MTAHNTTGFNPSPALAEQLILDFCSSHLTLLEVAAKAGIGPSTLIEWLSRPEIAAHLHAIEAAMMQKARLSAAAALNALADKGLLPAPKRKAPATRKRSSPCSHGGPHPRAGSSPQPPPSADVPSPQGGGGSVLVPRASNPSAPPRGYSWSGFTFENVHLRRRV